MSIFGWIVLFFFLSVFVLIQGIGYMIAKNVFHPSIRTLEETRENENEVSPGLMTLYDSWQIEKRRFMTKNKTLIQVYDIIPENETKKFVIISHGYTYSHHGSIKYAKMFLKLGFHVILFDQRFHGESEGKNCTMGGYEKYDLYDLISDTYQRYGNDIFVGSFAESMGAATALMEAQIDQRVRFVGSDCSFTDLEMLVSYLIKQKIKMPKWPFVPLASLYFRIYTGLSFKKIKPIEAAKKLQIPVFYAHGLEDTYIPPCHTQILYDSTNSYKTLFWGENDSKHASSARKNESAYYQVLQEFIDHVLTCENDDKKVNP